VEVIRELQKLLSFKVEHGVKVAIVDEADKMNLSSANAFLKTLEEPPGETVIILVSARPSVLLPTIISRCMKINFAPLTVDVIKEVLLSSSQETSEAEALSAARFGMGSISRALEALEGDALAKCEEFLDKLSMIGKRELGSVVEMAAKYAKDPELFQVLETAKVICRDHGVTLSGVEALRATAAEDKALTIFKDMEKTLEAYSLFDNALREMMPPMNANKQLALESLMITLKGMDKRAGAA
ncbi:MAG: hypothetical protein KAR06_02580, partial [Deltaproteobacteria bacterium]|nr:hypothetical protein [Deltaproteobacteria bacterium]